MALDELRQVIVPRRWRCEGGLEAIRKRRGQGERGDPTQPLHKLARAGSALLGSACDDRSHSRQHGRRRRRAQVGAEETGQTSAPFARHPRLQPGHRRAPHAPRGHPRAGTSRSWRPLTRARERRGRRRHRAVRRGV
eukprot:6181532-Pleurochrysis_carterae.AAC.6